MNIDPTTLYNVKQGNLVLNMANFNFQKFLAAYQQTLQEL